MTRSLLLLLTLLMLLPVSLLPAQRERRERMDDLLCFTRRDYTRLIIQFTGRAEDVIYRLQESPENPSLFYVDFYGLRPYFVDQELPVQDGMLRSVQVRNYREQNAIRLIFHLEDPSVFGEHVLRMDGNSLVVDLMRRDAQQIDMGMMLTQAITGPQITVVIDPGHGGEDSGARSPFRINGRTVLEKDINLAISRRVQHLLNQTGHFTAHMTRSDDRTLSLENRVEYARRLGADLFISIHSNDAGNPDRYRHARGLELYFISTEGASNHARSEIVQRARIAGEGDVQTAVISRANQQINSSYLLCEALRHTFQRHSYWRPSNSGGEGNYRGIFRRNFHVLRNFEMPCALVETGFVTHPQECQLLVNPDFQNLIARNIVDGIIVFHNTRASGQASRGGG